MFQGGSLVVPEQEKDAFSGVDKIRAAGVFGGHDYYAPAPGALSGSLLRAADIPGGWKTVSLRETLSAQTGGIPGSCGRGAELLRLYHLLQWRDDSRFCGSCGNPNGDAPDELARLCPRCGRREYPRISPAVITLVLNDREEALLAHNKNFKENVYSLIAGFAEAGESLEAAVVRELREEVSVEIRDLRYAASQPWPFPNSLMIGFTARYAGGRLHSDGVEIADAQWFSRKSVRSGIPELPGHGSISRYLLEKWLSKTL